MLTTNTATHARMTVGLKPGMILSNEPGFYLDGKYGIRIENLVYVREKKGNKLLGILPVPFQEDEEEDQEDR